MSPQSLPELTEPIRFAAFQLDPRSGVLRKHGVRIRLQDQPFRVLLMLIEKSGELVTREELQHRLWPETPFGDFDHSLNISINKIREALGDSPTAPEFIETVPRRGYRFIAEVEAKTKTATPFELAPPKPAAGRKRAVPQAISAAILSLTIVGVVLWLLPRGLEPQLQLRRLTNDHSQKFGPVLTDGTRLYFQGGSQYDSYIAQLAVSGGEPTRLPAAALAAGSFIEMLDLTPDRQELLLTVTDRRHPEAAPLWTLQIAGGSLRRLGELLAVEARYSPDGKQIAFTKGRQSTPGSLWIASSEGANPRRLLETQGYAVTAPVWSPQGARQPVRTQFPHLFGLWRGRVRTRRGLPGMWPGAGTGVRVGRVSTLIAPVAAGRARSCHTVR